MLFLILLTVVPSLTSASEDIQLKKAFENSLATLQKRSELCVGDTLEFTQACNLNRGRHDLEITARAAQAIARCYLEANGIDYKPCFSNMSLKQCSDDLGPHEGVVMDVLLNFENLCTLYNILDRHKLQEKFILEMYHTVNETKNEAERMKKTIQDTSDKATQAFRQASDRIENVMEKSWAHSIISSANDIVFYFLLFVSILLLTSFRNFQRSRSHLLVAIMINYFVVEASIPILVKITVPLAGSYNFPEEIMLIKKIERVFFAFLCCVFLLIKLRTQRLIFHKLKTR